MVVDELKTIMQVSRRIHDEPEQTSVVCQLLQQWATRHSLQSQKKAWKQVRVNDLDDYGFSAGFVWWILRAEQRGELSVSLPNLSKYGSFSPITSDFLEILLQKIQTDICFPLSKDWRDTTQNVFSQIGVWGKNTTNSDIQLLTHIETIRKMIARHDLTWSEQLCRSLPRNVRGYLYTDDNDIAEQQKIIKELKKGFFKFNTGLFSNVYATERFLNKIQKYSLEKCTQKDGLIFAAIGELLSQCNSECLKIVVDHLIKQGWKKQTIWENIGESVIASKCHNCDHEYIDTVFILANVQQRTKLFTWVVEGIANTLYQGSPQDILLKVKNVLEKPYAQPTVFDIRLENLRDYTNYVMELWDRDPKMAKKHPGDAYARSGLNLTSCEDFLAVNQEHFSSPVMKQAVDLLNTVTHPSLQGVLEFWGRLHNIDFGIDKPHTFELPPYYCAGKGDEHVREKAHEIEKRIAISGNLPQKKNVARRKI